MNTYRIAPIQHNGDQYQFTRQFTDDPVDIRDFVADSRANGFQVFILGKDKLAESDQVEDIRGLIRDEPELVLAVIDEDDHLSYWGAESASK